MDKDWNLISVKEASEILGVKPSTIHGWLFKKTMPFPYYQINKRTIRFKKTEVVAYLESIRQGE